MPEPRDGDCAFMIAFKIHPNLGAAVCATHVKVVTGVIGVGQSELCAMTRKEFAVEFVIPTMFAIVVGLVLGLVVSAGALSG